MREDNRFTPNVMQAQIMRGLPAGITLYGGVQLADEYRAAALGVGKDLGAFGALSMDVTQAKARFDDGDESRGNPIVFLYSKRIDATNTISAGGLPLFYRGFLHPERMGIAAGG
jgi:outer membrane usher protein